MEELERGISRISIEKKELKREFDKLSLEQKRIKEVVKHIQICISKREHYEGYRKNPNDKNLYDDESKRCRSLSEGL